MDSTDLGKNTHTLETRREAIYLRLAMIGCPVPETGALPSVAAVLLERHQENARRLSTYLSPPDWRIQQFLDEYLYEAGGAPRLPSSTLVLDEQGMAREMSLPVSGDTFTGELLKSYRVANGVLHNPTSDRRTTQGVFHVVEGGLTVPDDKKCVSKRAFAHLLRHAFNPPREHLRLPYTSCAPVPAECFVSLYLRPVVCPEVPGFVRRQTMEIRFFVPGSLVSNLDFVETIFGNAGDPNLPENDPALEADGWSGHTGCVVLAPHLTRLTKVALGLPKWDDATEHERRDGMCWRADDERYNEGKAFKITARDERGVIVTLIADNYYGYCKKEIKTQLSYAANLAGWVEEEHAGGALVFPSFDLGEEFSGRIHVKQRGHNALEAFARNAALLDVLPEGHAVDRRYSDIFYVPEDADFDLRSQTITWTHAGSSQTVRLRADAVYLRPSGYKVRMLKPDGDRAWRLIGTGAEPTFCHKPCTVSGGGKSEISKPITDAILQGSVFVSDFRRDFDAVADLLARDYSHRFRDPARNGTDQRPILGLTRSLGSVIKLLTPSEIEYSDDFNAWLATVPPHIKELVFVVKRFCKPAWGDAWRDRFSVDVINGVPGNELKCEGRRLRPNFLRVGFAADGSWRVFGLQKDFHPSVKLQMEDDITASIVVPASSVAGLNPNDPHPSVKFTANAEARLFQRPDDAIHRGNDRQAERDLAEPDNFLSNFEPLSRAQARQLVEDAIGFTAYTEPMQQLLRATAEGRGPEFVVSSAHPRLVNGEPSKNPRYLQRRPDREDPRAVHLGEMGIRLFRKLTPSAPVYPPVNAVVPGRRNNPPEPAERIRSLAVFNPIHYMDLPEAFMEFISSMTGRSPSMTGAGIEGAMTKGPFNALPPIYDLNGALVSYLLTEYPVFITAAGYIGPRCRVDHDVSLLVPEVWTRMLPAEREPRVLQERGYFEPLLDFEHNGQQVLASRLGWRMTAGFVREYFGRVFSSPHLVFTEELLRPERQDAEAFVDGVNNILETHRRVAEHYFADGTIEFACPPLKALLHIMRDGRYEGMGIADPMIRKLFTRKYLIESDWYVQRLAARQEIEIRQWFRAARYLEGFLAKPNYALEADRLGVRERLACAWESYHEAKAPAFRERLRGTLGADPSLTTPDVAESK
ncbi:MAG: hypothetical protein EXS36_09655 [Pedosphaera sp.]|nr:hypothetical protein [Pedosphaera sp.]